MSNNKIFVSYRRQDASGEAGRLVDHLQEVFGENSVFLDVETIEAGLDFVEAIDRALNSCKVLIAMIGPHWVNIKDSEGNPRLFKEDDFIRLEIAAALKRDIRVIPVLVNGAVMPSADQLPEDLKPLTRRHAHEISSSRWKYDCEQLTEVLEKIVGKAPKPAPEPKPFPSPPPKPKPVFRKKSWIERNYLWLLGGFVLISVIGLLIDAAELEESIDYYDPVEEVADQPIYDNTPPKEASSSTASLSGRWILRAQDGSEAIWVFSQRGEMIEFAEYNLLDVQVGSGSGLIEDGDYYADYYNSLTGISGEVSLFPNGDGWSGEAYFPSTQIILPITLTRN